MVNYFMIDGILEYISRFLKTNENSSEVYKAEVQRY